MTSVALQSTAESNKVLRNTFLLLALTALPTIAGTFSAMVLGLPALVSGAPWWSLIGALVVLVGLIFLIYATASSWIGIPVLGLFTFAMGAILSTSIDTALGHANGAGLISAAAAGTAAILVGCSTYAMTTKRDFSEFGGFLLGTLFAVIALSALNILVLHISALQLALSFIVVMLFSAFLVYDVQQVVRGGVTNYIIATLQIYLDVINIFSALLDLMLSFAGDD